MSIERGPAEIVPHTNINTLYRYERGDVEAGFAASDLVFEGEYTAHALSHVALEVHAAIAQYDGAPGATRYGCRPIDRSCCATNWRRDSASTAARCG